jgi:hypothetical protein
LAAAVAALIWFIATETQSIKLVDGGRIEILKVSAGTNHFFSEERGWRGFVAQVAPSSALQRFGFKRNEVARPRGSLALWVREFDRDGRRAPVTLRSVGAVFGDGRYVEGTSRAWSSNVVMIELSSYPRADAEIKIAMFDVREKLSLTVKNPAPTKRAQWRGGPLRQTNAVGNMLVSVWEGSRGTLRFHAKATNGPPQGWMFWRCEVEDSVGNWEHSPMSSHGWQLDPNKFERGPLKLMVYADEYVSAGFVSEPAVGEIVKLSVSARGAALGLKDVFLLGRGDFVVSGGVEAVNIEKFEGAAEGVRIVAERPNAAVMFRPSANVDRIDARVRERSERRRDGGNVFQYLPWRIEERKMTNGNVLRYAAIGWEYTTNRTEVEVIVRHRPVEFFVDLEKERAGPETRP